MKSRLKKILAAQALYFETPHGMKGSPSMKKSVLALNLESLIQSAQARLKLELPDGCDRREGKALKEEADINLLDDIDAVLRRIDPENIYHMGK